MISHIDPGRAFAEAVDDVVSVRRLAALASLAAADRIHSPRSNPRRKTMRFPIPNVTTSDPTDCYKRALPSEPVFTLLARDPQAPALLRLWADRREAAGQPEQELIGNTGKWTTPAHPDAEKIAQARYTAARMEAWRFENEGEWRVLDCPPPRPKHHTDDDGMAYAVPPRLA